MVHGLVQGVWFRESVRRRAAGLAVAGWVRNNPDGTVEAAFEGVDDAVERMVRFAHEGPRGAVVERVDLIVIATHGMTGWRQVAFGSVAERVVRLSGRPVLTVHAPRIL